MNEILPTYINNCEHIEVMVNCRPLDLCSGFKKTLVKYFQITASPSFCSGLLFVNIIIITMMLYWKKTQLSGLLTLYERFMIFYSLSGSE